MPLCYNYGLNVVLGNSETLMVLYRKCWNWKPPGKSLAIFQPVTCNHQPKPADPLSSPSVRQKLNSRKPELGADTIHIPEPKQYLSHRTKSSKAKTATNPNRPISDVHTVARQT